MAHTRRQQPTDGSVHLRVAVVQMKFAPTIDGNLGKIEQLLGQAARRKADAVLLPECATTGYAYDFSRLNPSKVRARTYHEGSSRASRILPCRFEAAWSGFAPAISPASAITASTRSLV